MRVEPRPQGLAELRGHLRQEMKRLAPGNGLGDQVGQAAERAFWAVCLGRPQSQPLRVEVETAGGQLRLRLEFEDQGMEPPPGLAPALFSPPAARVGLRRENGLRIWTAFWDMGK